MSQSPVIRYVAKKRLMKAEENKRKRRIKEEKDHDKLIHLLATSKPHSLIAKMKNKHGDSPLDKDKDLINILKEEPKIVPYYDNLEEDSTLENPHHPAMEDKAAVFQTKGRIHKTKNGGRKALGRLDMNAPPTLPKGPKKEENLSRKIETPHDGETIFDLEDIFVSLKETVDSSQEVPPFIGSDSSDDPLLTVKKTKVSPREKIWMKRDEFIARTIKGPTPRHR
jgi:hypothetical protein